MSDRNAETDPDACAVPPSGWRCTRPAGHRGPCAAVPSFDPDEAVLLPCPHCGGQAVSFPMSFGLRDAIRIECLDCHASACHQICEGETRPEYAAANAWNRRPTPPPSDPSVVETTVRWHKGGAQVDPETGEAYLWPWGEAEESPPVHYEYRFSPAFGSHEHLQEIWKAGWPFVRWYCDPADLAPPTIEGGPDANNPA